MEYYTHVLNDYERAEHKRISERDYDDESLPVKHRKVNDFKKVSGEYSNFLLSLLHDQDRNLSWKFEFNYSHSPVHVHTDNNHHIETNTHCKKVMILPFRWDTNIPASTILFDQTTDKKVFRHPMGHFRDVDGTPVEIDLDTTLNISDEEIEAYGMNPEHRKMYNGLSVKYNYVWDINQLIVFDSNLLHTSSDYNPPEYKLSINGLGFE